MGNTPPATTPSETRRRHTRAHTDLAVDLFELDPRSTPTRVPGARIVDLSRGGMRIRCARMLHIGRSVIAIANVDGEEMVFTGVTKHVVFDDGTYKTGVEFESLHCAPRQLLASHGLLAA